MQTFSKDVNGNLKIEETIQHEEVIDRNSLEANLQALRDEKTKLEAHLAEINEAIAQKESFIGECNKLGITK